MSKLTFEQAMKEATIYNALLQKGLIDPNNEDSIDIAIEKVFE